MGKALGLSPNTTERKDGIYITPKSEAVDVKGELELG